MIGASGTTTIVVAGVEGVPLTIVCGESKGSQYSEDLVQYSSL
jgi:hypothetical protein